MIQRHTDRGFDRLVNFSDAVVAIAITLLILPLTDIAGDAEQYDSAAHLLRENAGTVTAFLISFLVLADYWLIHHRMFEWINDYDNALAWLNIGWLFAIVVLPFSTELISHNNFGQGFGLSYTLNLAVISLFMAFIAWRVQVTPALQPDGFRAGRMRLRKSVIYCIYFICVGLYSLVNPDLASWLLLGLLPLGLLLSEKNGSKSDDSPVASSA